MTIKSHLFYSFIAHAVMLAYLLSLPLYRGSLHLDSLGDIFVHLTSRDAGSEKSDSSQKAPAPVATKAGKMAAKQKEVYTGKEPWPTKSGPTDEKPEQVAAYHGTSEIPKDEIVLKEAPPVIQAKKVEIKEEKQPEVKKIQEEKPPEIESPKIDEIKEASEIKEAKSVALEPKVPEVKIERETEKTIEKKAVSENAMPAEKTSRVAELKKTLPEEKALDADRSLEKKKDEPAPRGEAVQSAMPIHERKDKEPLKPSETAKPLKPEPPVIKEQKMDSGVKDDRKDAEPVRETLVKASPPAQEAKAAVARDAEAGKTKSSDKKKPAFVKASALKKGPSTEKKTEGKKDNGSKVGSAKEKASEIVPLKAEEHPVLPGAQIGAPNGGASVDQKSTKAVLPDEGKTGPEGGQAVMKAKTEVKKGAGEKEKKPSAGMPISEMLLLNDIKIEIFLKGADASSVSTHLFMRAHPTGDGTKDAMKRKEVGINETSKEGPERKKVLYVAKADKGLYTFVMRNESDTTYKIDIICRLFEKKKSGRLKNIKNMELLPHAEFTIKFVLPEAVFWDDEEYFTGAIESSDSVTKFNNGTGLIWKEEKDGGGM